MLWEREFLFFAQEVPVDFLQALDIIGDVGNISLFRMEITPFS
jgi:hypothetical protein